MQSFWKDTTRAGDPRCLHPSLSWRPGDFAAHCSGMPLERRLRYLEELRDITNDTQAATDWVAEPLD